VAEVRALSAAITRFLLEQHCKLIVVACNTASAAALEYLRAEFNVPIVGMEPALKPAAEATQTGHVGVLATEGTLNGYLFKNTAQRHADGVELHVQVGEGLVELVEAGQLNTPETEAMLRHYLEPLLAANVDQIALGCTHYPLLLPLIERIVAGRAHVIDPAQAVARQVQRVMMAQKLETGAGCAVSHHFYTTGQPQILQNLVSFFSRQRLEVRQIEPLPFLLWEQRPENRQGYGDQQQISHA
jgi:glutamate racemase